MAMLFEVRDMATILIDGLAIEPAQFVCDPTPGRGPAQHVTLRIQWKPSHPDRSVGDVVPIVFPFCGETYRGEFRTVVRGYSPDGCVTCTFVSDHDVAKVEEPSLIARLLHRNTRRIRRGAL
jgi:hypothetical protein